MSGPDLWDLANDFAEAAERYLAGLLADNGGDPDALFDLAGKGDSFGLVNAGLVFHAVELGELAILNGEVKQALRRARERCQ